MISVPRDGTTVLNSNTLSQETTKIEGNLGQLCLKTKRLTTSRLVICVDESLCCVPALILAALVWTMLLIVAGICISIIANEIEEVFFCLLTLQISFVKCWFKPLVHICNFIVKAFGFVFLVPVWFFMHPGHIFK